MSYEMSGLHFHRRLRIIVISSLLCLTLSGLPRLGPAHADPPPCDALITVPKPPPVPFPSPKPSPVPSGGISGSVGAPGIPVTLYRCQGSQGVDQGTATATTGGYYAFSNLDAAYDYYVEAAFPPPTVPGSTDYRGAYAVPGMQDVDIDPQ